MVGLTIQWIIITFLILACLNYLWLVWDSKYSIVPIATDAVITDGVITNTSVEGFSDGRGISDSESTKNIWYENEDLFDGFYVSVYDKIMQLERRFPAEVLLIYHKLKQ